MKRISISFFIVLLLLAAPPCFAASTPESSEQTPNIFSKISDAVSGYYKTLITSSKSRYSHEDIFGALQRLRIEFKPKLTENLELFLTYDHELFINDFSHTPDFKLIRQNNQKNLAWMDAEQVISDTDHVYERQLLYRVYLKFESAHSRWIFGKQLIDWGRMRFYSPLDLFNPPLPTDIEPEQRTGFDALNVELFGDEFSGVNFIYGPETTGDQMTYALRLYKKIGTYDTFLIGADRREEKIGGLGFDGYLGQAGFRGEFTYTSGHGEEYPRAALGLDYTFNEKLSGTAEYFYNGGADGDVQTFYSSILAARDQLSVEKNLLNLMLTYEFTPLLKFRQACIYDIDGGSAFFNPELRYSVHENLDVAAGCQLFARSKNSEFQGQQNLYYAELKYFF